TATDPPSRRPVPKRRDDHANSDDESEPEAAPEPKQVKMTSKQAAKRGREDAKPTAPLQDSHKKCKRTDGSESEFSSSSDSSGESSEEEEKEEDELFSAEDSRKKTNLPKETS
ncbi:hypothetical protein EIP91_010844, partial [Steccherinum ochraceum]